MDLSALMMPTPGPASPAGEPSGNPGAMADSMSKVREAVNMLEMALPGLEMGSEAHKAVLDSIQKISKIAPSSAAVPGVQNTQLLGLQKQAQENAMLAQLTRGMGQGPAIAPVQPAM
jgi:hypothetical protein